MDLVPKDEIISTAKKVIETFSVQYLKCYTLALVRQIKLEVNAEPGPDWQLETRPVSTHSPHKKKISH